MELLGHLVDIVLHLDKHLNELVRQYGPWTYLILFVIVFAETGLVVTPFLPGDSLLFAVGALAATEGSPIRVEWVAALLIAAAILGDTVNYQIGHFVGPKIFTQKHSRWFKREHLDRTHEFFERYGGKTIIIARFVPIVRTFAPFVAGVGAMTYWQFLLYNVVGALLWVGLLLPAGYFFGNAPIVKDNFSIVILAIIALSLLPALFEFIRARSKAKVAADESRETA
jgi:membrane-associated protein